MKEAIGSDITATDKEIHDSLWHYYFDVDKTVAYLKSKSCPDFVSELGEKVLTPAVDLKKPASPKKSKPKPESKFDQAAKAAQSAITPAEGKLLVFLYLWIHGRSMLPCKYLETTMYPYHSGGIITKPTCP